LQKSQKLCTLTAKLIYSAHQALVRKTDKSNKEKTIPQIGEEVQYLQQATISLYEELVRVGYIYKKDFIEKTYSLTYKGALVFTLNNIFPFNYFCHLILRRKVNELLKVY